MKSSFHWEENPTGLVPYKLCCVRHFILGKAAHANCGAPGGTPEEILTGERAIIDDLIMNKIITNNKKHIYSNICKWQ